MAVQNEWVRNQYWFQIQINARAARPLQAHLLRKTSHKRVLSYHISVWCVQRNKGIDGRKEIYLTFDHLKIRNKNKTLWRLTVTGPRGRNLKEREKTSASTRRSTQTASKSPPNSSPTKRAAMQYLWLRIIISSHKVFKNRSNKSISKSISIDGYWIAANNQDSLDVLGDLDYDFVISDHYWLEIAANSNFREGKSKITVTSERVEIDDESVSRYTDWTDEVDKLVEKAGPLQGGLWFHLVVLKNS